MDKISLPASKNLPFQTIKQSTTYIMNVTSATDFKMPFIMPASKASRLIKKGLKTNRPRIAFPWQSYFFTLIMSSLPLSWTDELLSKAPKKI